MKQTESYYAMDMDKINKENKISNILKFSIRTAHSKTADNNGMNAIVN